MGKTAQATEQQHQTETTDTPGQASDNGTTPETVAPDAQPEVKVFTQTEIDRIIAARLEQERRKFADYDAVKAELASIKTAPAQGDQAQRLATLETENKTLSERNQKLSLEAAIAKQAGAIGLDATAAAKLLDMAKVSVGEDGSIVGLEEAVKAVAEQYPGLVGRQFPRTQPVNPGRGGDPAMRTDADRRRDYFGGNPGSFWSGGGVVHSEQ